MRASVTFMHTQIHWCSTPIVPQNILVKTLDARVLYLWFTGDPLNVKGAWLLASTRMLMSVKTFVLSNMYQYVSRLRKYLSWLQESNYINWAFHLYPPCLWSDLTLLCSPSTPGVGDAPLWWQQEIKNTSYHLYFRTLCSSDSSVLFFGDTNQEIHRLSCANS